MNYVSDEMKISEMEEGREYPIDTSGHQFSEGCMFVKNGDELSLTHFWLDGDDIRYEEVKGEDASKQTFVLHKDIFQVVRDAAGVRFEELTLGSIHSFLLYDLTEKYMDNAYTFPIHLKNKMRVNGAVKKDA